MAVTLVKLAGIRESLHGAKMSRRLVLEYRLDLSRRQYSSLYELLVVLDPRVNESTPDSHTVISRVIELYVNDGPVTPELQAALEARLEYVLQEHALHDRCRWRACFSDVFPKNLCPYRRPSFLS